MSIKFNRPYPLIHHNLSYINKKANTSLADTKPGAEGRSHLNINGFIQNEKYFLVLQPAHCTLSL